MFTFDHNNADFINSCDLVIKILGVLGAIIIFIIGYRRYIKDQTWRRSEFVSKEIREFTSDKMVRNVMYMLDWGDRKIELFPDRENYDDRFARVDRKLLRSALLFHELKVKQEGQERFTFVEVEIRDNFDHFLNYFEKFEQFIVAGLIETNELKPYLDYWVKTISEELEKETRKELFIFINSYRYYGTQNLFKRFGKNIVPS